MGEELDKQKVDAGTGAPPADDTPAGAGTGQAAPGETTPGTPPAISEEVQALIKTQTDEAIKAERAKYEGKDGHLARLKSAKDKELAALRKQLRTGQQGKVKEAKALIESNPDQAAQILLNLAEEQDQQIAQDGAQVELVDWQHRGSTINFAQSPRHSQRINCHAGKQGT